MFKICGFEGGIRILKQGGSLNSTRARLSNHQISKISIISFWFQISVWVFKICGFKGGIGILKCGGSRNSTGAWLLYHQTSKIKISLIWTKNSLWLIKLEGLKIELGFFLCWGDPFFRLRQGCEITDHLKISHRHLFYYSNVFDVGMLV